MKRSIIAAVVVLTLAALVLKRCGAPLIQWVRIPGGTFTTGFGNGNEGPPHTVTVCSKPVGNARQGLCDMAGYAWELMQDRYHWSYGEAPDDGSAWVDGDPREVIRGGSWSLGANFARSTVRSFYDQDTRYTNLGFRPAR